MLNGLLANMYHVLDMLELRAIQLEKCNQLDPNKAAGAQNFIRMQPKFTEMHFSAREPRPEEDQLNKAIARVNPTSRPFKKFKGK